MWRYGLAVYGAAALLLQCQWHRAICQCHPPCTALTHLGMTVPYYLGYGHVSYDTLFQITEPWGHYGLQGRKVHIRQRRQYSRRMFDTDMEDDDHSPHRRICTCTDTSTVFYMCIYTQQAKKGHVDVFRVRRGARRLHPTGALSKWFPKRLGLGGCLIAHFRIQRGANSK